MLAIKRRRSSRSSTAQKSIALSTLALTFLVGCKTTNLGIHAETAYSDEVSCSKADVSSKRVQTGLYEVHGCGQKARYQCVKHKLDNLSPCILVNHDETVCYREEVLSKSANLDSLTRDYLIGLCTNTFCNSPEAMKCKWSLNYLGLYFEKTGSITALLIWLNDVVKVTREVWIEAVSLGMSWSESVAVASWFFYRQHKQTLEDLETLINQSNISELDKNQIRKWSDSILTQRKSMRELEDLADEMIQFGNGSVNEQSLDNGKTVNRKIPVIEHGIIKSFNEINWGQDVGTFSHDTVLHISRTQGDYDVLDSAFTGEQSNLINNLYKGSDCEWKVVFKKSQLIAFGIVCHEVIQSARSFKAKYETAKSLGSYPQLKPKNESLSIAQETVMLNLLVDEENISKAIYYYWLSANAHSIAVASVEGSNSLFKVFWFDPMALSPPSEEKSMLSILDDIQVVGED